MAEVSEKSVYNITLTDESNEEILIDSSSMNEMTKKRKLLCGLSSCCNRQRSESAQMIAGKTQNQPISKCQKCKQLLCCPFRNICGPSMKEKSKDEKSTPPKACWKRLCCCYGTCKKGKIEKSGTIEKQNVTEQNKMQESKWNRANFFKSCFSRISKCFCCNCCHKKEDEQSMASSTDQKPNETPSSCIRYFCFCCLCCRKKSPPSTKEVKQKMSTTSENSMQSKSNCCSRMCKTLFCCCCKKKSKQDSRRTSMLSKKQSLAPTIPPPEEQKPKLDMVLVEHASLMKGAIPVLPMCLAWFCLICNIFIPGTGTIFSGLFCLCIGIPRFSQHDGARGRIGSFIINCIVGISQAFTIIFCLVGWGWSIWWGTIMIHLSKRHRKIKKAEFLRQQDAEQQAAAAAEGKSAIPRAGLSRGKSRDVERGIN